jgi:energy coupling factor transporter S component ThiW
VGEVIGTGLLGSLASVWIVAPLMLGRKAGLITLMIAFSISTLGGTIIGLIALHLLRNAKIWEPND